MLESRSRHSPYISISLLSASALGYEVLLMRLFSIIQWHHFAYMIISLALLGYGASGTFLSLYGKRLVESFPAAYVANIILFACCSMVSFLLAQQIPFNALEILWDIHQSGYLLLIYLLLALPFFFAANAIGLAFMCRQRDIAGLYAADLMGAGVGSIAIIILLFAVFPALALRLIAVLGLAAAVLACWELSIVGVARWGLLLIMLCPMVLPTDWTRPVISPYKGLSQALRVTGGEVVLERSSPLGLLSVVRNPVVPLRHAPGLSLRATQGPPAQLGVFIDADAMTAINAAPQNADLNSLAYLERFTNDLPYHLQVPQKVLVLGAGGGVDIWRARYHNAKHIDAVEINPQIVELLQRDFAAFSGNPYQHDNTRLYIGDARGFVTATKSRYDLIQLALLGSFDASNAGLYALNENYLYTVEAIQLYLQRLRPGGYLALTGWIKLPPRDSLRIFATAVAALRAAGVHDISRHLVFIRSWQTSTLLIKQGVFSDSEIARVKIFCKQNGFDTAYYHGMPAAQANRFNRLRDAYFFRAATTLLGDHPERFLDRYKFDIHPATDDKPYFFQYLRWSVLPEILSLRDQGGLPMLEWGYVILLAAFIQAMLASIVLIVLPLVVWSNNRTEKFALPERGRTLAYFLSLGLGFLFIEIVFIQKSILFLHHPIYSAASVLAAFLLFAGAGSAYARRCESASQYKQIIQIACAGIVVVGLLYSVCLDPLFMWLSSWSIIARIIMLLILIAPLAFCMGIPFPLGLRLLSINKPQWIPWAWGVNGCASVLSAILATLMAIDFGFSVVIWMALGLYASAALLARGSADVVSMT